MKSLLEWLKAINPFKKKFISVELVDLNGESEMRTKHFSPNSDLDVLIEEEVIESVNVQNMVEVDVKTKVEEPTIEKSVPKKTAAEIKSKKTNKKSDSKSESPKRKYTKSEDKATKGENKSKKK